jgi:Concanavalin A-like lectin/glucanases superfamily/F5/8 type C domain
MTRLTTICIGAIFVGLVFAGPTHAAIDPDTILGAWLLDEGAGDTTKDASGNGHDGTLVASPSWVTGYFGNALEFDGSATYVDCGSAEALNVDLFSVSFWCYIPSIQGWNHMISRGSHVASGTPGSVNWGVMMYDAQETILYETYNDTAWVGITTATTTGEWHHVVATLDGTAMQLYHDGVLAASGSGATLLDASRSFVIGARSDAGSGGGPFIGSLDEVGFFNVVVAPEDIETIMNKGLAEVMGGSLVAIDPQPSHGQTDVQRDPVLSWTPGDFAATHNVYFSDNFNDVSNAAPGAVIADGITETKVDPGQLAFETTYYWRVDEVNSAPDHTVFEGTAWSFTVEPFAYPVQNVVASTNATSDQGDGPENTVNGSGLDSADLHSIAATDMWVTVPGQESIYLEYELDQVYKLHEMLVWNYNVQFELILGFGLKDVTVEYSENGTDWMVLGDVELAQATARADYAANTTIAFDGVAAKYVRLSVNSGWGMLGQFGLSEVRFMYIPAQPREPQPADGVTNVDVTATMAWRAGRDATSHEVYFGTSPEALPLADTVSTPSYDPGTLDLGMTYYWQIAAIQDAESWAGGLWSFSTREYLVVEDFENYNDDDNVIYETWVDGWVNETGSTVGYLETPFAERSIVHSGRQSMPLFYNNAGVTTSEAEFELAQNWATNGIQSLSLYFHGAPANTGGQLYVKINGTKIPYDGDPSALAVATWQPWNIDLSTVGNVSNVNSLTIGIEGAGASGVVYIDDIRLYPREPQLVTPIAPDDANLVAHYTFDGNINDSSGSGSNGTANGAPTYGPGADGQAIVLDGVQDYVSVVSLGISGADARTISGWAKADTTTIPAWTDVFGFTGPSTNGQHFDIQAVGDTGTTTLGYYGLHRHGWEQDILPIDLEWHHLAATFDGATVSWYGDGLPIGSGDVSDVDTPGAFHMGKREDNENFFPGSVDEVRVYDRALSDGEIAYLAGKTAPIHKPF